MRHFFASLIERLCIVLFALAAAQGPLFISQYTVTLRGHIEELHYQLDKLETYTTTSGQSLETYVTKLKTNPDPDVAHQGKWLNQLISRRERLQSALHSLTSANAFSRPAAFFTHLDPALLQEVARHYQWGFQFTFETALWTLFGLLLGWRIGRTLTRSRRKTKFSLNEGQT